MLGERADVRATACRGYAAVKVAAEAQDPDEPWPGERDARPWVIAFVVFVLVVAVGIATLVMTRPSEGGDHHGAPASDSRAASRATPG